MLLYWLKQDRTQLCATCKKYEGLNEQGTRKHGSAGEATSLLPVTLVGREWRREGQARDEPW